MTGVNSRVRRLDLAHADAHDIGASGVQFSGATYEVAFRTEAGLRECLDTMMSLKNRPATPRLYLQARDFMSSEPGWPPTNLRFDYDLRHGCASRARSITSPIRHSGRSLSAGHRWCRPAGWGL